MKFPAEKKTITLLKRENNYLTKMTPHYRGINQNTVFKINFWHRLALILKHTF